MLPKFLRFKSITGIERRRITRESLLRLSRADRINTILDIGVGIEDWSGSFACSVQYESVDLRDNVGATWVGDFYNIDFPKKYDLIIATEILEHISQPRLFMKRVDELLADNGTFLASVPFFFKVHRDPDDYYRYTDSGLKAIGEPLFNLEYIAGHGNKLQVLWELLTSGKILYFRPHQSLAR